ncbi:MAG: hypothetical protein KKA19_03795, partial [Candidatus Margulisbacteria bacterium]|nr:hypothetical protein [Candidatus Margulisiibacteriota bacterium]
MDLQKCTYGVDAVGRGNTYLAAEDSNNLVFQNYSLLSQVNDYRLSLMSTKILNEFTYNILSFSMENWSFGYYGLNESAGDERDDQGNRGKEIFYSDTNIFIAYGFSIKNIDLGLRAKYLRKYFSVANETATGTGLDLAGHYKYNKILSFGAEISNIYSTGLRWSTGTIEYFPQSLNLGTKMKLFGKDAFYKMYDKQVDLFADLRIDQRGSLLHFGAEYWPIKNFVFRLGMDQDYRAKKNNELGINSKITFGLGLIYNSFYFDYAYHPYFGLAEETTHYFSASYRFNLKKVAEIPEDLFMIHTKIP